VEQRAENACGYHGFADGKPVFDYTCDDCMLPWNHYDPPEQNDLPITKETIRRLQATEKALIAESRLSDIQGRRRKLLSDRRNGHAGRKGNGNIQQEL
jgi:hypothetical protein